MTTQLLQAAVMAIGLLGGPAPGFAGERTPGAEPRSVSSAGVVAVKGAARDPAPPAPPSVAAAGQARTQAADTSPYAARERDARNLDKFRGGHVAVYIGGSTLAVVLVVVLIVLLV